MSISESKNAQLGFLYSILSHLLIAALFYFLTINKKELPPKEERKTLELSKFQTKPIEKSVPQKESKPQEKPKQSSKTAQREKPEKTPQKEPAKEESAPKTAKSEEQNKTFAKKPADNSLLSELNNEFKSAPKEAGSPIQKLYGKDFERMGREEQKFIKDNLGAIGKITEKYLRYPDVSARLRQQGASVVEFFLYPNGDISDLRLLEGSGYRPLDKNSIETIEIAYKDYPRPSVKTKIRIYVQYSMY